MCTPIFFVCFFAIVTPAILKVSGWRGRWTVLYSGADVPWGDSRAEDKRTASLGVSSLHRLRHSLDKHPRRLFTTGHGGISSHRITNFVVGHVPVDAREPLLLFDEGEGGRGEEEPSKVQGCRGCQRGAEQDI